MNHLRRLTVSATVAAALLAGALTACSDHAETQTNTSASPGFPARVSTCGQDYTYDKAPSRVLLGAPGIIDTLDALGVADSAIGYSLGRYATDERTRFPSLTRTSEDYAPSREFLIGAQPDLYLSNDEQQLLGDGAASKSDLATIPANLYVLGNYCAGTPAPNKVDAVYADVTNLGKIFGVPDAAKELNARLAERVTKAAAGSTRNQKLTAAAIQVYDGKVYALGGSYYGAVLDSIGLKNIFGGLGGNFTEINREQVIAATPDVVFVAYGGDPAERAKAVATGSDLFKNAPAARNGKVFTWDESDFEAAGVRIIDVVEQSGADVWGTP